MPQIEIEDIRRLNVAPGETLVVRFPTPMTHDNAHELRERVAAHLPEGVRLLVFFGDVEMDVIVAGEQEMPQEDPPR